jgi:hypothetical protein
MVDGTPCLATQVATKVSAQVLASKFFGGTTSNQQVDLSMTVNR